MMLQMGEQRSQQPANICSYSLPSKAYARLLTLMASGSVKSDPRRWTRSKSIGSSSFGIDNSRPLPTGKKRRIKRVSLFTHTDRWYCRYA